MEAAEPRVLVHVRDGLGNSEGLLQVVRDPGREDGARGHAGDLLMRFWRNRMTETTETPATATPVPPAAPAASAHAPAAPAPAAPAPAAPAPATPAAADAPLRTDIVAGPGGVMTDEVGVVTGELTLESSAGADGSFVVKVQY